MVDVEMEDALVAHVGHVQVHLRPVKRVPLPVGTLRTGHASPRAPTGSRIQ